MEPNRHIAAPGQEPPHPEHDLEKHILSVCLSDEGHLTQALDAGLSDKDFFTPGYQMLFRRMVELARAGEPLNFANFYSSLTESEIAGAGGTGAMAELGNPDAAVMASLMFGTNVRRLMGWRKSRNAWVAAREMMAGIEAGQNPDEAMRPVREMAEAEADRVADRFVTGLDALQQMMDNIGAARKAGGLAGVTTGFPALDTLTSGLQPGKYYVLGARTSVGKTALALNLAVAAARAGKRALFVTAEMAPPELVERTASIVGRVSFAAWYTPGAQPTKEKIGQMANAVKLTRQLMRGMTTDTTPDGAQDATPSTTATMLDFMDVSGLSVEAVADAIRAAHRREPLALVIVDYLQLLGTDTARAASTTVDNLSTVSRTLRDLAKSLNIPLMALAQLNRDSSKAGRAPLMVDLKGCGQIEQDANVIFLLHRPEAELPADATEDERDKVRGVTFLNVAKNRAGRTGVINMRFTGETYTFQEL